jgi:hypothetical protein
MEAQLVNTVVSVFVLRRALKGLKGRIIFRKAGAESL